MRGCPQEGTHDSAIATATLSLIWTKRSGLACRRTRWRPIQRLAERVRDGRLDAGSFTDMSGEQLLPSWWAPRESDPRSARVFMLRCLRRPDVSRPTIPEPPGLTVLGKPTGG